MALACTWGGFADTNLNFSEFFGANHTVAVRFMLQYPYAYSGPMLAVSGTGMYRIGQGDYRGEPPGDRRKLLVEIGTARQSYTADLDAGTWHHLAVVRRNNTIEVYLDGAKQTATFAVPAGALPSGTLRMGKDTFDAALDAGGRQYYGMVDDVAIFGAALSATRIQQLAQAQHLAGTEANLLAGYVFGYEPPGGLPQKLARPVTTTPAAFIIPVSANRDNAADAQKLPLSLAGHMHLPFPIGQTWELSQAFDNPNGSHRGYAAFCWDFILAGKPASECEGEPFYSAAPGVVDHVSETPSNASNFVSIRQAEHEFCDYLHLVDNSAGVNAGDHLGYQHELAKVGMSGTGFPHLHIALTNLGENNKGSGGAFVTFPATFANYEVSDDAGATWQRVTRGMPRQGQWVRKPPLDRVRYTAVWSRGTEGEFQVYGWDYDRYRAKYDEIWPKGWRLKLLNVYVVNDHAHYTAVWHPSTEGEFQVYGWSYDDYRAKYDEIWPKGWRLKLLSVFVVDGNPRYTAAWHPSTEGEYQVYGWTYDKYRAKYDEIWPKGWRLKLLNVYVKGGQPRYTAVWRPSTEGEFQMYGATYEQYRAKYDEIWPKGWRLKLLSVYAVGGQPRYTAVWRPATSDEFQVYSWPYHDYRAKYDVIWHYGWRLQLISPHVL